MKKASDLLTEQAEAEKSIEKKKGTSLFLLVGKGLHFSCHIYRQKNGLHQKLRSYGDRPMHGARLV